MLRRCLPRVLLPCLLGLFVALPGRASAQAGITQQGKGTSYRCYDAHIVNLPNGRPITDLHIRFDRHTRPEHLRAPPNWGWTVDDDGSITFRTPPASPPAPGSTTSAAPPPSPVGPGDTLDGFRICLLQAEGASASFSYGDGTRSKPVRIIGDGKDVPEGGVVPHSSEPLPCVTLKITAPAGQAVWDIHLSKAAATSPDPNFDDVAPPPGWHADSPDPNTVNLDAGQTSSIPAGGTVTITVCFKGKPNAITWSFTDAEHRSITGASGTTSLTLPSPPG
jgi:hypothetical protein